MFENTDSKVESARQSLNIRDTIRNSYKTAREVQYLLSLYNTDPTYTSAVNAIFSAAERAELGTVANLFSALVTELETNHSAVITEQI